METKLDKVKPLTLDEFCALVGYDPTQRGRLLRDYDAIRFDVDGRAERFCSFVTSGADLTTARIFVNPHILYHGRHPQQVQILGKFCGD
jgi:hypothetical protein